MPTWDEIEELIVHGDTAAALELLARKTDYFCKVANSICQDGAMAEDTVQKFFQEKSLEQNILVGYDPEKSRLKTWLYRIVYNLAIAETRDPDRKGTGSLSDDETPEPAARSEEPVKQALSEDIRYMSICYPLLKGKEARALILTAALWPTADIARELKIREVTVRYYRLKWRRTIAGLRRAVENQPVKYRTMAEQVATLLLRSGEVKFSQGPIERKLRSLVRTLEAIDPPCSDVVRLWLSGHDAARICGKLKMVLAHAEQCLSEFSESHPELVGLREPT